MSHSTTTPFSASRSLPTPPSQTWWSHILFLHPNKNQRVLNNKIVERKQFTLLFIVCFPVEAPLHLKLTSVFTQFSFLRPGVAVGAFVTHNPPTLGG